MKRLALAISSILLLAGCSTGGTSSSSENAFVSGEGNEQRMPLGGAVRSAVDRVSRQRRRVAVRRGVREQPLDDARCRRGALLMLGSLVIRLLVNTAALLIAALVVKSFDDSAIVIVVAR